MNQKTLTEITIASYKQLISYLEIIMRGEILVRYVGQEGFTKLFIKYRHIKITYNGHWLNQDNYDSCQICHVIFTMMFAGMEEPSIFYSAMLNCKSSFFKYGCWELHIEERTNWKLFLFKHTLSTLYNEQNQGVLKFAKFYREFNSKIYRSSNDEFKPLISIYLTIDMSTCKKFILFN